MDNLLVYILVCCAVCSKDAWSKKHGRENKHGDGRIVGGYNTTIQTVPYQVFLLLEKGDEYFQCGGSIISKKHILTAAHCMVGVDRAFVTIGTTRSDVGGNVYATKNLLKHPNYDTHTKDYDVGIITLDEDMELDGINAKIIELAEETAGGAVPADVTLLVAGWGATTEGGAGSITLMAVEVTTHSLSECKELLTKLTDRMFCAGPIEGGKDSCQGDSGGPAVKDGIQIGLVSFGYGCARPNRPGIYTDVSAVRAWIKSETNV